MRWRVDYRFFWDKLYEKGTLDKTRFFDEPLEKGVETISIHVGYMNPTT